MQLNDKQKQDLIERRPAIMAAFQPGDGGDAMDILARMGISVTIQALNYYRNNWDKRVTDAVGPNEPYYLYALEKAAQVRLATQALRQEMVGIN